MMYGGDSRVGLSLVSVRTQGERRIRGTAIYPLACYVNHECLPNVARMDDFDSSQSPHNTGVNAPWILISIYLFFSLQPRDLISPCTCEQSSMHTCWPMAQDLQSRFFVSLSGPQCHSSDVACRCALERSLICELVRKSHRATSLCLSDIRRGRSDCRRIMGSPAHARAAR